MDWVDNVVNEFGRQIGISQLLLDADGNVCLTNSDQSQIGIMYVKGSDSTDVIVYRSIPTDYLTPSQFRLALGMANFKHPHPWTLQVACDKTSIFFLYRIPERAFLLSSLEQALMDLNDLFSKLN